MPAFLGAATVIVVGLTATALVARWAVSPPVGVDPLTVELVGLALLACGILFVLVRLCFVPEACFLGGYGPFDSIRVSWTLTILH